jgi:tetratricopeptide (TPR) repeat protein
MTVCVYAICKNERQFVDRWVASMAEADGLYVLDTGSTDGTVQRLRELGVQVTEEVISPWRFDTARNRALDLVPEDADLCVCTDLDEVFHPGWRAAAEAAWTGNVRQLRYRYTWSFLPDGREGLVFWSDKMHSRHGFRWTRPVHEVLAADFPVAFAYAEGVQLDHHPDPAKSRSQYLPLLELAVAEDPDDDRSVHYLGREYLYQGRWTDCIRTLERYLHLPSATWPAERCASMRFLAKANLALGRTEMAQRWLCRAVGEAPHLREPWVDFAAFAYETSQWDGVLYLTGRALAITERPRTYFCEPAAWGALPWDLAAMAAYYTGQYARAAALCKEALALEPDNERLQGNLRLMEAAAR